MQLTLLLSSNASDVCAIATVKRLGCLFVGNIATIKEDVLSPPLPMGWFQRDYQLSLDFLCNAEFSPCRALPEYISGHLFTWLVCWPFQWRHGLLFTNCIVWDDKGKVICFKRSHWIHSGRWSSGSQKLQLFQLSQHSTSPTVDWYLLQLTFHEIWHQNTKCSYIFFSLLSMKYDIRIQNAAIWRFVG